MNTYEINARNEVIPYTSGRKCTDTRAWRDATELELQQQDQIQNLERELTAVTEQRDGLKQAVDCANDLLASVTEQRDRLAGEIVGWRNKWECAVEIAAQAEVKRDILVKSIEPLKYWRDISECDCSNPLPQGGCLRCDLDRILNNQ